MHQVQISTTAISAQPCLACNAFNSWPTGCLPVQKVVLADLSSKAVSALSAELARQAPQYLLSLKGTQAECNRAASWLVNIVKVTYASTC